MDKSEAFCILGISETKDEAQIKNAYRKNLSITNPEDNPEGFKRLRNAYDLACRLARETEAPFSSAEPKDETISGLWMDKVKSIYGNMSTRCNKTEWEQLFREDCFVSLEEEENCRRKFFRFLMEHYRFPSDIWTLFDKKLSITNSAAKLKEYLPADFVRYIINKCEHGEDVLFEQFEGAENAEYDLFLQCYDRCWQALQEGKIEIAKQNLQEADRLDIKHPVMEICRAEIFAKDGQQSKAIECLEIQVEKYTKDVLLNYNLAEMLWKNAKPEDIKEKEKAAKIYCLLKEDNDSHYMANVRLSEWYYQIGQYKQAKKCAEKVLYSGASDEFMEMLAKINEKLEVDLEDKWVLEKDLSAGLELGWCYLQDGRLAKGLQLTGELEPQLLPEKRAEWLGLVAKLLVEEGEFEKSISMTRLWEEALKEKIEQDSEEEKEKDLDRIKQSYMIRMQCFHNLGFRNPEQFRDAAKEGEAVLDGNSKDFGILMELAQIYIEMKEYEKCDEIVHRLIEDYHVYATYAIALESHKRRLNAIEVLRTGNLCIRYFPSFVKAYEYMAKVYLDLDHPDEFKKILDTAEQNGVESDVLKAYRFQTENQQMPIPKLNQQVQNVREKYRKALEEGRSELFEEGLKAYTELLYHCPDSFMFVERGIYNREGHRFQQAKSDFEKALTINPANAYALNGLSFVYKCMGDYEKALFYLKRAVWYMDKEMPPIVYTDMAELYSRLGCFKDALSCCQKYQELAGEESIWFLKQLADIYMNLGNVEEANRLLEQCYQSNMQIARKKQVECCAKCGEIVKGRAVLAKWSSEIKKNHQKKQENSKKGFFDKLENFLNIWNDDRANQDYLVSAMWMNLVAGAKKDAEKCIRKIASGEKQNDSILSDSIFGAILCEMPMIGKMQADRLKQWLVDEKQSSNNLYFNRERAHCLLEILAFWYTDSESEINRRIEDAQNRQTCRTCTNAVCRQLEGIRILALIRFGNLEEAKRLMERKIRMQPSDEYLIAIRSMRFPSKEQ